MGLDNSEAKAKDGESSRAGDSAVPKPYQPTLVESPFFIVSLVRQIRDRLHDPKITRPAKSALNPETLRVTEMPPWYRDLPNQVRILFEKPTSPRVPITSQPIDVPGIWRDYQMQPASWLNSFLVHAFVIVALSLPFVLSRPPRVTANNPPKTRVFYPYYKLVTAQPAKGQPRGGSGGDRSPIAASVGAIPKFDSLQLAPPTAKQPIEAPRIPVTPTLIGPPEMVLPEMALHMAWGDPQGAHGPQSNGLGDGGGIGNHHGTGIGDGDGPGLGPGEDNGPPVY
jgi:protein TonB